MVGPFGALVAADYVADDEVHYVVAVPTLIRDAAALLPPIPGALPFPALWITRYLSCSINERSGSDPSRWYVHVPCGAQYPGWVAGPGTLITIGGLEYTVTSAHGERRID